MLIVVEQLNPKERQNHQGAQNIGIVITRSITTATEDISIEVDPNGEHVVEDSEPNEQASMYIATITIFLGPANAPKICQIYHYHYLPYDEDVRENLAEIFKYQQSAIVELYTEEKEYS